MVDKNIARKIVNTLTQNHAHDILEIGPGHGILTELLLSKYNNKIYVVEIDNRLAKQLHKRYPQLNDKIYNIDFLKFEFRKHFCSQISVIGNFPYNISNRIFFKILENKSLIPEVVCMIQKEVAERITSKHGNKNYGILSVLLQAFYNIKYEFTVNPTVFDPPPKVKSAVISMNRKNNFLLKCDETDFFNVVKTAFNQRRKMLRNSLKQIAANKDILEKDIFLKRPEQLSISDFENITILINHKNS